jgi:hypothetical protein
VAHGLKTPAVSTVGNGIPLGGSFPTQGASADVGERPNLTDRIVEQRVQNEG